MNRDETRRREAGEQTTPAQRALVAALEKLLRPIAYLFVHQRVPFQVFANVAKRVFVNVAHQHFNIEGRTQTKSRVAMLTGVTRADVTHILTDRSHLPELLQCARARPTAILEGWHNDPEFQGNDGTPMPLPVRGDGLSFEQLVRKYGADLPPRTVLEELERAGLLSRDADDRVYPLGQYYFPKTGAAPELIQCLGTAGYHLHSTIAHNVLRDETSGEEPFFQRQVLSRALPPHRVQALRQEMRDMLTRYYDEAADYLSDAEELPPQEGYHSTGGVGFYYFEE